MFCEFIVFLFDGFRKMEPIWFGNSVGGEHYQVIPIGYGVSICLIAIFVHRHYCYIENKMSYHIFCQFFLMHK